MLAKTGYATTAPAFTSANSLRVRDFKHTQKRKREAREDNRQTLGQYQRIPGMKEATWSVDMVLQGSGALGSLWSCSPFLKAFFGTETINGGASVVYTMSDDQAALGYLDFLEELSEVMAWEMRNCWMAEFKLSSKGGANPRLTASGGCSDWIMTGSGALGALEALGQTDLTMAVAEELRFAVGSRVIVGTSNPATTGHTITAIVPGTNVITVSPGLDSQQVSGAIVRPWSPSEATPPFELPGMRGKLMIGADEYAITEFELTGNLGLEPHDDQALVDVVEDYSRSWRDLTGFIKFRAFRDQILQIQSAETDHNRAVIGVELGDTAGDLMDIDLPQVEIDFSEVELPSKGSAIVTVPFIAMTSDSETSDEGTVTLR